MKISAHHSKLYVVIMASILGIIAIPLTVVQSDVSPDPWQPGSNIYSDSVTNIRMANETVFINAEEFTADQQLDEAHGSYSYGRYHLEVAASFDMENSTDTDINMAVYFPMGISADDPRIDIQDLTVKVNGESVTYETITRENESAPADIFTSAKFPVTFLANATTRIELTYASSSVQPKASPLDTISYIFSTGAGWQGTIGSAKLILQLPDSSFAQAIYDLKGASVNGRQATWTWTNFEPTDDDDFLIEIMSLDSIQSLIAAQADCAEKPLDPTSWKTLAFAYYDVCINGYGLRDNIRYCDLADEYFEKLAQLDPTDPAPAYIRILDFGILAYAPQLSDESHCAKLEQAAGDFFSRVQNQPQYNEWKENALAIINLSGCSFNLDTLLIFSGSFQPTNTRMPTRSITPQLSGFQTIAPTYYPAQKLTPTAPASDLPPSVQLQPLNSTAWPALLTLVLVVLLASILSARRK